MSHNRKVDDTRPLVDARNLIQSIMRRDANEAETRRRVERIFERVMGYDPLVHLSRERAVHGVGDTEHVDFAVQLEEGDEVAPMMMVELKRVGVDLAAKHVKQASRYAVDAGCEWVLVTNGREWQLHHVEFGQPPETKMVEHWNLLNDNLEILARKFSFISLKSLKRGLLDTLWQRTDALAPENFLKALVSNEAIANLRRILKRNTGVSVTADHIVAALRRMLNEAAAAILENVQVTLPTSPKQPERSTTRGGGARVRLSDMMELGLIAEGSELFAEYRGNRYVALLQGNGEILFEGQTYKTPSAAGGAITAKHNVNAPNGWVFWQSMGSAGEAEPLENLRQKYLSQRSAGDGDT